MPGVRWHENAARLASDVVNLTFGGSGMTSEADDLAPGRPGDRRSRDGNARSPAGSDTQIPEMPAIEREHGCKGRN